MLDKLLVPPHANKAELLMVLDRPEDPLHTNGSENDIRCSGRDRRDAFLSLNKTCAKLGIAFWDYLGAWLRVPDCPELPTLAEILSAHYAQAT